MKASSFLNWSWSLLLMVVGNVVLVVDGQQPPNHLVYGDRWNYDTTQTRSDGFTDFGPAEWGNIECDESTVEGLDACVAYRDKWHTGQEWELRENYCRSCPINQPGNCGRHHMSPINLDRDRGIGYWENDGIVGDNAHENANECIDVHWMKYEDSWCSLDQLIDADAFTVERHALRISQPITVLDQDTNKLQIDCQKPGRGRRFGRIDFSKGFSQWWFLSHIDIHTPSEHTQEGKRYDAELQLQHFYSVNATVGRVANEMSTVSIFLETYEDAPPYRYLDKVICLWRRHESQTRQDCNLPPIEGSYPGCFPSQRRRRNMMRDSTNGKLKKKAKSPYLTIHDWLVAKDRKEQFGIVNVSIPDLEMDQGNFDDPGMTDDEWGAFIEQESAKLKVEDTLWKQVHREFNDTLKAHEEFHERHRALLGGDELEWFNYFAMLGVRTEYYYRYSGSQTIPPCYGNSQSGTRHQTNHWRVMKDPVRIHPRQLREMKRLLAKRIAPKDASTMACQPDTAARVGDDGNVVDTARPLQYLHPAHFKVFCECKDWPSKWPEDRGWCDIEDINERFYTTPYNFQTSGF